MAGIMMTGRKAGARNRTVVSGSARAAAPVPAGTVFYTAPPGDLVGRRACHGGLELLGYSCGPARDDPEFWGERIHPEDRQRVVREMSGLAGKGSVSCEYRLRCADGSYKWVLDGAVMLRDQRGSPREIVGAVHDITDRKELDEGIWEHEEFLDTLLESASNGLFVVDEKCNLVYLTAKCQALLGLSTADWVRDECCLPFHPADAKGARARFFRALNGKPCRCRSRVRVADGSYGRMTIDLSPVMWRGREFVLGIISEVRPAARRR